MKKKSIERREEKKTLRVAGGGKNDFSYSNV
jgi:hypothetical protein